MTTSAVNRAEADLLPTTRRRFRTIRLILANRRVQIAGGLLVVIAAVAIVGPWWSPYEASRQDLASRLLPPSGSHWLGTDSYGRDMMTNLFLGTRVSMQAAVEAIAVAVFLGVPAGLTAGYVGGWFERVTNSLSDALLALPSLLLALAIVGISGGGLHGAMVAVGITLAPRFFRIARGTSSAVAKETFIEAARSLGCGLPRILGVHVLNNAIAPIMVQVTFGLGLAIIAEGSLSFLGIGISPPDVSLGTMVRDAFLNLREAPYGVFPASIMIAVLVYLSASLGDALRDTIATGGKRR